MVRPFLFFSMFLFFSVCCFSQIEITWETLADVEFTDTYIEEEDGYYYYPHFGMSVRELAGKEVILRGFILSFSAVEEGYYILSKSPFASCFFCGSGGPETVVELNLKSKKDYFEMDEVVTMKGVLRLNSDDIYQCNYILDKAQVYSR
ncbi:MAG: DUF3299 domain-containing protein [Flavobacteriales bacterium]|nr:DUF3299 domain-containing protein [Flavobacteriales bacterium]|tara:strand:+ start:689 stop:1132 length:444 start_codon:yes stop_codon:yes gene_type:complete